MQLSNASLIKMYKPRTLFNAHKNAIWTLAWGHNEASPILVSGSVDETIKIWPNIWDNQNDAANQKSNQVGGTFFGILSVALVHDDSKLYFSSMDSHIRLYDMGTHYAVGPVQSWTIAISPNDKQIATGTQTGNVNLFSTNEWTKTTIATEGAFVQSIAYSPDGNYLACGHYDGKIDTIDIRTNKILSRLNGHQYAVRSLQFSPDSHILYSGSDDQHINIYELNENTSNPFASFGAHASWILSVNLSPDGKHLATGSSDKSMKIWDVTTREQLNSFTCHPDQVWCVAYSPIGNRLVSSSEDGSIQIYDITP